jgi:hypothetical protein
MVWLLVEENKERDFFKNRFVFYLFYDDLHGVSFFASGYGGFILLRYT